MANIDSGEDWHATLAKRIGVAIMARRKEIAMTAQQLSERCRALGAPIHRTTITKIENGRPRFDLGELLVIAAALNTSPVVLVYPGPYDTQTEAIPGDFWKEFDAAQWFSGLSHPVIRRDAQKEFEPALDAGRAWVTSTRTLRLWRELDAAVRVRNETMARGEFERDRDQISFYDSQIQRLQTELGVNDA